MSERVCGAGSERCVGPDRRIDDLGTQWRCLACVAIRHESKPSCDSPELAELRHRVASNAASQLDAIFLLREVDELTDKLTDMNERRVSAEHERDELRVELAEAEKEMGLLRATANHLCVRAEAAEARVHELEAEVKRADDYISGRVGR